MLYRFIGSAADLGDGTLLERFGQAIELDPQRADALIAQNVALLPEAKFAALGFTDAELAEHFTTELHGNAGPSFLAKRDGAWKALHQFRSKGE